MRAIRTEKQKHIQFKKEIDKAVQPVKRLSPEASARLLARLGLKPKTAQQPLLDADGACGSCHMFGHDSSRHKIVYCGREIVMPAGVVEELERFPENNRPQYQGKVRVHHKGHNTGALRQKGKLSTGIRL